MTVRALVRPGSHELKVYWKEGIFPTKVLGAWRSVSVPGRSSAQYPGPMDKARAFLRAFAVVPLLIVGCGSPLTPQAQAVHAELSMKPGDIPFTGTFPAPHLEVSDSGIIVTGYLFGGDLVCMKHTLRSRATNNSIEFTIVSQTLPQYQTHGDTVNDCDVMIETLAWRIAATGLRSGEYAVKVFWKRGTAPKELLGSWAPISVPNAAVRLNPGGLPRIF